MDEHSKELINLFQSNRIEFLVVGAHALGLHAKPRYTEDIDLWINPTPENATRIQSALSEFGLTISDVDRHALTAGRQVLRIGVPPYSVDIRNFVSGVEFHEAWPRRVKAQLGEIPVDFISKEDFIRSKTATGRKKDIADLEMIERISGKNAEQS